MTAPRQFRPHRMGRALAFGTLLTLAMTQGAQAQATRAYTCNGLQDFLSKNGPATLDTGQGQFGLFIMRRNQCLSPAEKRFRVYVTASDGRCQVYQCETNYRRGRIFN